MSKAMVPFKTADIGHVGEAVQLDPGRVDAGQIGGGVRRPVMPPLALICW